MKDLPLLSMAELSPPWWLRITCFLVACVVPAAVVLMMLVSLVVMSIGVTTRDAILGVSISTVVFVLFLAGILAVGLRILLYQSVTAAQFVTLLAGTGAVLYTTGYLFAWFNSKTWTTTEVSLGVVVVYYLATTSVLHGRLAYLLARRDAT